MFAQFLVNGFITGVLYSLLAIGFALVYNTTKIFHIASAALFIVATYVFYSLTVLAGWPMWFAAGGSLLFTALLSLVIEWIIYRPLKNKNASLNVMMIASIGVMTILINVITLIFGNETKVINNAILPTFTKWEIIITSPQMMQLTVGTAFLAIFLLFISRTRIGVQLRALSADDVLFETLGYSVKKARSSVFLLSGVFIALTSCLTVYDVGMDPHMGMNILINAMVAMIIGGVGRFGTCVLGGLLLGITQSVIVFFWASNWQNAITFMVLLIFLFLWPRGIAGYKQRSI